MNKFVKETLTQLLEKTAKALEANNMQAFVVESKEDVVPLIKKLVKPGSTVSCGGSESLVEAGVSELLSSGMYNFIDRNKYEDKRQAYLDAYASEAYFCSSNAVTEDGFLYNVDGNSNRISAISYGPESVVMVVGANKIVRDLNAAFTRVKEKAAPPNTKRLSCQTPCNATGVCIGTDGCITDGCKGEGRICCNYLISGPQRHKNRIKVILVAESLGF